MVIAKSFRGGRLGRRRIGIGPEVEGGGFFRGEKQSCAERLIEELRIRKYQFSPCGALWIVI